MTSLVKRVAHLSDTPTLGRLSPKLQLGSVFLLALAVLLLGYMFLGRGFAHLGLPPLYVGEIVLLVGLIASGAAIIRRRFRLHLSTVAWILVGFMALGVARTVPYLSVYGMDALRDAVLWGYGAFALMIYVLADRTEVFSALRKYGWTVPVFAFWLPISYYIFRTLSADIQADELGSNVPLVFFKSGDMAVHIVGSIAFLVLGAVAIANARLLAWRALIAVPLVGTTFLVGSTNRGGLLTVIAGVAVVAALAILLHRSRKWAVLIAPAVLALVLGAAAVFTQWSVFAAALTPEPPPVASDPTTPSPPEQSPRPAPITCEAAPASRSLVTNPGFELGIPGSGRIEGWATWAGTYNIVEGGGYRGANYASAQNTGDAWTATITSSMFPMQAGQDISVSLWAKAIEGSPVIATLVNWYDSSDALISSVYVDSMATEGNSAWQESTGVLSAPAGTTHAGVQLFEAAGNATIGLDEVIVKSGDFLSASPAPAEGRPVTIDQIIENFTSIFSLSSDGNLEGTKTFRLRWWGSIINYTIFGQYFWTGKGFGVNLADDDGFQVNEDRSLRAPHNSHVTVLARMGVPGSVLWVVLQGAFAIGLVRSILTNGRTSQTNLAAVGALVLAYWAAMMVNTSFDPYLEGPQGGIWFWSVFGMGMVVMRLTHAPHSAHQPSARGG